MTSLIEHNLKGIAEVCARHRVHRLDLFGSAVRGDFDPSRSDIDFVVQFEPLTPVEHADQYFGLIKDLEALLAFPVDVIELEPVTNPYFREAVEESKTVVYEAA